MDKTKILIVDDDLNISRLLKFKLNKEGYDTLEAHDGEEALIKANSFRPNLILLDIMMPKMSGWEVNKELRKHPELRRVPVIMVTAVDRLDEQLKSLSEKNIKDYITKPFNFSELVNTVKRVLGQQIKNNSESSFSLGKNKQGELNE